MTACLIIIDRPKQSVVHDCTLFMRQHCCSTESSTLPSGTYWTMPAHPKAFPSHWLAGDAVHIEPVSAPNSL